MNDFFQTAWQAQIQFAAGGAAVDVTALVNWWRKPVHEDHTLNSLCLGSRAESLVIDGIRRTTAVFVTDPLLRELMTRYMTHACALTVNPDSPSEFVLPHWLCWIRDTERAARQWGQLTHDFQLPELKVEFAALGWSRGIQSICAAYPRAAIRFWAECAERLRNRARQDSEMFFDAVRSFQESQRLALEIGIKPPVSPSGIADATSIAERLETWRLEELSQALDRLFWDGHLMFLSRVRGRSSPALQRGRKAKLTQLIRSANRGESPELVECLAICRAHDEALEEQLADLPKSDEVRVVDRTLDQPSLFPEPC